MRTLNRNWKRLMLGCLLASLLCFSAALEAADQPRVVAHLDEPFEVNGQLYEAGLLAVRELGPYNPSSVLTEITVNASHVGILLAEKSRDATSESTASMLLFERRAQGHLALAGFAYRGGEQREFYTFRVDESGGHWLPPGERNTTGALIASQRR